MAYSHCGSEHSATNCLNRFTSVDLTVNFHFHGAYELVFVREGELRIVVDSRARRLASGDACLLFPGQIHRMYTEQHSLCEHIVFSPDVVQPFHEKHKGALPITTYLRLEDEGLGRRLAGEYEDDLLLISDIYRVLALFDEGRRYQKELRQSSGFAMRVLKYVEEHYREEISLAALAAYLGYDYHYLSGCISDTFHTGFLRIVNEFRIGNACQLLRTTEKTAAEIAEECGYDCMRSFNRNFRQLVGVTPTVYRKGENGKMKNMEEY